MASTTFTVIAPQAYGQFTTKWGGNYVADGEGFIYSVAINDLESLLASGCVQIANPPSNFLGKLLGANFNSTGDQAISMFDLATIPFRLTKITVKNASISLTTAAGGIYTAVAKGGTAVVANTQVYTGLTTAALATDLTIVTAPGNTVFAGTTQLYLSLTTAQGAAATADIYLFGDRYQ